MERETRWHRAAKAIESASRYFNKFHPSGQGRGCDECTRWDGLRVVAFCHSLSLSAQCTSMYINGCFWFLKDRLRLQLLLFRSEPLAQVVLPPAMKSAVAVWSERSKRRKWFTQLMAWRCTPKLQKSPYTLKGVETDRNLMYLFWKKAATRKLWHHCSHIYCDNWRFSCSLSLNWQEAFPSESWDPGSWHGQPVQNSQCRRCIDVKWVQIDGTSRLFSFHRLNIFFSSRF